MTNQQETGVSPVIGVMLMLVVTIIIAAVVSAFSGGLTSGTQKAPQANIQATYSQSGGLTIQHLGGDPIGMRTVNILMRPSQSWGSDYQSATVNKSLVFNPITGQQLLKSSGVYGTDMAVLKPGDIWYISAANCEGPTLFGTGYSSYTWLNTSVNLGRTYVVELHDMNGGMVAKSEFVISP